MRTLQLPAQMRITKSIPVYIKKNYIKMLHVCKYTIIDVSYIIKTI